MYPKTLLRLLAAALMAAAPATVASARSDAPIEQRVEALGPGEFIWQPEASTEGPVEVVIGLAEQRAYIFRGGTLIGASTISSGREGYESPIGRFQILQKNRVHRSNRYNSAPMPFMQRLNWYGVALHGGHIPGYAASHGCIRLPMAFARNLFGVTELGGFVFVTEDSLASPAAALELARANADAPMPDSRMPAGAAHAR